MAYPLRSQPWRHGPYSYHGTVQGTIYIIKHTAKIILFLKKNAGHIKMPSEFSM